ncbi:NAD(+) diphosphatase [Pseudodonghicola flavimaris]|uniref:NAD(+) diphosphatase n=1 Tax=Pseudodonghicola flavimaris TaxID=3050036 RepID=A0ABT7EXD2_9RHOB|nr:NAD(+) diphosphatase [Pseudodonghicola flavimaris]MDK3017005.1 NAD(+) diphosphatase [Pseudodonghicola flavimaris]
MRTAEQVTFGGSGLNRAAELRGDATALAGARAHPGARCLPVWRGKPLLTGEGFSELALLRLDDPLFSAGYDGALPGLLFLGLKEDGAPRFAADLSGWTPEEVDLAALGTFFDPSEQRHPDLPDDTAFVELRRVMTRLSPRDAELAATAKAVMEWHRSHRFCAACGAESGPVQAGWQRDCPACGTHHFPRTDPVVIMLITHGDAVLMGRSPNWPEGMYSLLAGFIEPGETLEAAVRREVFEEAGVQVGRVGYLASQPWPFPASLMFGCYGEAISREIRIDENEIEDAIWVSRSDMMGAFAGEHPTIKPARKGAIAHFLLQNWLADTLD